MPSGCLYRKLFQTFPTGGKLEVEPGLAEEIIFHSWPGNALEFPLDELEVLAGNEVVWGFQLKLLLSQHGLIRSRRWIKQTNKKMLHPQNHALVK